MKGTLKITLLSDACPGSGIGRGADIDIDPCFDPQGLPVIPAKRVKGGLREAAEIARDILGHSQKDIDRLFGTAERQGVLNVGNAKLAGSDDLLAGLQAMDAKREEAIDCFCELRRQTALGDDGRAKAASLRTTRVLRKGLVFEALVELMGATQQDAALWQDAVSAWRTLGMNVTRGLGRIRAEWREDAESCGTNGTDAAVAAGTNAANATVTNVMTAAESPDAATSLNTPALPDSAPAVLRYRLALERPVLVSGFDAARTEDALSGTVMRASISVAYARAHQLDPHADLSRDDDFRSLFLRGEGIRFLSALPCLPDGVRGVPAPLCVVRDKHQENHLFNLGAQWDDPDAAIKGDQPTEKRKSMSGAYLTALVGTQAAAIRPLHRTIYHHAVREERTLFTYDALEAGQRFAGEITGSVAQLTKLLPIFARGAALQIGRSRSAEYGLARVEEATLSPAAPHGCTDANGRFLAVAVSPVCLVDNEGHSAQGAVAFQRALHEALNVAQFKGCRFYAQTTRIGGYSTQWKLSRPTISAYASGTALQFEIDAQTALPTRVFVGTRQREGMGEIALFPLNALWKECNAKNVAEVAASAGNPESPPARAIQARLQNLRDLRNAVSLAQQQLPWLRENKKAWLNAATIGFLLELLRVSPDREAFKKGIGDVKDGDKRKKINELLFGAKTGVDNACADKAWKIQREYLSALLEENKRLLREASNGKEGTK